MSQIDNKRIAKNTAMLYIRMLFSMLVSFYTSRLILATLGITDYGINNVVGGLAGLFTFLNDSLAGATSRFLTYTLGQGNIQKLKATFSAAFTIHIILALIIFLLCETIGLWLLEYKLVIPPERMNAARVVFQISTIRCMIGITQVPFGAVVIAHERMDIFAYFGIANVVIKVILVYLLTIINYDKLILLSVMFFAVSLLMLIIHRWYDITHFEECSLTLSKDKELMLPMLKFSGWDLFGNMSVTARGQGINVLQNMFWGPAVNAATGVANTVMGSILGFSNNFMTAVRPQVVKLYAQSRIDEMQLLAERGSKVSFFLLYFISFPCFLEMPFVLDLWLEKVPDYAVAFTRLSIIFNWNVTMFLPLMHIIHATGKMKRISLINGMLYISVVPITYILFKFGLNPTWPFILNALFVLFGAGLSNLYSVKLYIPSFKAMLYLKNSLFKGISVAFVGSIIPTLLYYLLPVNWMTFLLVCLTCVVCLGTSILLLGLTKHEREVVIEGVLKKFHLHK